MNNKLNQDSELVQKEYYNKIAEEYDNFHTNEFSVGYFNYAHDLVFKDIPLKGVKFFDSMCGGGKGSIYFIKRGADLKGQDISIENCKNFLNRNRKKDVTCSSVLSTPFKDSSFDIVYVNSLHHVHPNVNKAMDELFRVLKPNGIFCCMEPLSGTIFDVIRKIWYKLDTKYFQSNEKAIDIDKLEEENRHRYCFMKKVYGGNIGYFIWSLFIALRISNNSVASFVANPLIKIDSFFTRFNIRFMSCWGMLMMRKR